VQTAAAALLQQLDDTNDWYEVQLYATRILSYGRASALQQALFTKTKSESEWASEEEREAAEERFERIVGTCLDAWL
jgi:hypothetical protein